VGQKDTFAPPTQLLGGECPGCPPKSTPMIVLTSGMAWLSQWTLSQHSVDASETRLQCTRFQLNCYSEHHLHTFWHAFIWLRPKLFRHTCLTLRGIKKSFSGPPRSRTFGRQPFGRRCPVILYPP